MRKSVSKCEKWDRDKSKPGMRRETEKKFHTITTAHPQKGVEQIKPKQRILLKSFESSDWKRLKIGKMILIYNHHILMAGPNAREKK